jgi:hypothetical protein
MENGKNEEKKKNQMNQAEKIYRRQKFEPK